MALSLDDRLLGEKVHNYCSSDEGEPDSDGESGGAPGDSEYDGPSLTKTKYNAGRVQDDPPPGEQEQLSFQTVPGQCVNTGPKGVVEDWRRYRQLEHEKREEQEKEKADLAKRFAVTCRPHSEDEKAKQEDEEFAQILESVEGLEGFLSEYRAKRFEELKRAYAEMPTFGKVFNLAAESYCNAIDKESSRATILIHIYEENNRACDAVNGCFEILATEYMAVKFCRIRASDASMSRKFIRDGVPAILVYKQGELIGNLVRISKDLGEDFFSPDLESYLLEHGFLPDPVSDPITKLSSIRNCGIATNDDDDSDFDLD